MSERNTLVRALHDLGLAAWFGGSLMGAVGLNGAAEREGGNLRTAQIASNGWARWTPVNAAAIGAHLLGGVGVLAANRRRVAGQRGVGASTVAKTVLTGAALAATAYSRVLGKKIELASSPEPGKAEQAEEAARRRRAGPTTAAGGAMDDPAAHGRARGAERAARRAAAPAEQARGVVQRAAQLPGKLLSGAS